MVDFRALCASSVSEQTDGRMEHDDFGSRDNSSKGETQTGASQFYFNNTSNAATEESILTKFASNGGVSPKIQKEEDVSRAGIPSQQTAVPQW